MIPFISNNWNIEHDIIYQQKYKNTILKLFNTRWNNSTIKNYSTR